jgi:uncharacterized YigZ family protein
VEAVPRGLEVLDTIAASVEVETVVARSRFIATLAPAADEAAADQVVAEVRRRFYDARHHCTATVLGPDGQGQRSSDDGEPSGTAGAPMLAVLRGAELTEVVAVVTRYFGGTLLGSGGLVRAYGGAVTAALGVAVRLRRRPLALRDVVVGHADAGRLEHRLRPWLEQVGGTVDDQAYLADGAVLRLALPPDQVARLTEHLAALVIEHELRDAGTELRAGPVPGGGS